MLLALWMVHFPPVAKEFPAIPNDNNRAVLPGHGGGKSQSAATPPHARLRWNAAASVTTFGRRKWMKRAFGLQVPENLQDVVQSSRCALIVYDMQAGIVPQISSGLEIQKQC